MDNSENFIHEAEARWNLVNTVMNRTIEIRKRRKKKEERKKKKEKRKD